MVELRRHGGGVAELVVEGRPFLVLGGELGNSTASSAVVLDAVWPRLEALRLNTVLLPVYWELVEAEEGRFDFGLLDHAIALAQRHGMCLVLLWFGSFKNSMSCYAPLWVKADARRFPRARRRSGEALEIVSVFGSASCAADARAFATLMRHVREVDPCRQTVIMVQVENEVGMLGDARDHGDAANEAFGAPVPSELIGHLVRNEVRLNGELRERWARLGCLRGGSWAEVFGDGLATEEIFMAFHYARYVEQVARAGLREHELPLFVNAALNRPGHLPGRYPSAGPLPHLFDVWRAGAPSIDLLCPDIYFPGFADWCQKYHREDNPLFIPEAQRGDAAAVHALYAFGAHEALGFSPFSVDSIERPAEAPLAASYGLLRGLAPLLLEKRGLGETRGVILDGEQPRRELVLGDYRLSIVHDYTWEWSPSAGAAAPWPTFGGLVVRLGPDEYLFAGRGMIVTFAPAQGDAIMGIASIEEGTYDEGRWRGGRRLNGDESHQGRHLRLEPERFSAQRIRLYRCP